MSDDVTFSPLLKVNIPLEMRKWELRRSERLDYLDICVYLTAGASYLQTPKSCPWRVRSRHGVARLHLFMSFLCIDYF